MKRNGNNEEIKSKKISRPNNKWRVEKVGVNYSENMLSCRYEVSKKVEIKGDVLSVIRSSREQGPY
jgi:hypothetical protein